MRSLSRHHVPLTAWAFTVLLSLPAVAADIRVIYPEFEPKIEGKEVDWIYGDYLMTNDKISLTIAAPIATRDANLTVREIGASILDLAVNDASNDQLSAYIPAALRYQFFDPAKVDVGREGDTVYWSCVSSNAVAGDGTEATVRYELADGDPYVSASISIRGDKAAKVEPRDMLRADRTFRLTEVDQLAVAQDTFFRSAIGFQSAKSDQPLRWKSKSSRSKELRYSKSQIDLSDDGIRWSVKIYPATSITDLRAVVASKVIPLRTIQVLTDAPVDDDQTTAFVRRATVQITAAGNDTAGNDAGDRESIQTDDEGVAKLRAPAGDYRVVVKAPGYETKEQSVSWGDEATTTILNLDGFSGFAAVATDGEGNRIPVKATIYAIGGDEENANNPDFGPDSTRTFVRNTVYAVSGSMLVPIAAGNYDVHFSHGPEFNSESRKIEIKPNQTETIDVQLLRVVDSSGWVSAELHSHSSPSGDNTSDQYGRVENLLCEHLEFAPCTEHARISSYVPHLRAMGMEDAMATCSGMEVTGRPLPVNHQNSFPLRHVPHTQNGGGPRADANPVVQIERIAMWDDGSDKVVQMNHPNLHQIYGDLDVDGKPDEGFRKMLKWTDVIEVHPLQTIFDDVALSPPNVREMRIPLFQWMQLLNQGYRIPGVINTDAHYNHHGSGWRRNWFASSTDDPAKISIDEMVRQAEAGHIIMSTGPYMTVKATSKSVDKVAIPGDDLIAKDGKVRVHVVVQCPNWLDVNRVQIVINGRLAEAHNRTRKSHPDQFGESDSVMKFDSYFDLELDSDAHVIVATIGEGMTMEKVMGPSYGKRAPIAVSNPVFVDLDGNGFDHNHDELGLPLPKQVPHHHHHDHEHPHDHEH
ncbi:CehA/McbA family metallohydrolase [Roseiconus lacunae]|uniref:CehA/McbA family metallohydrolase n=1 Tax=Roseiconus lacunae TaxID=2605694 RepID=A0ABT7PCA2_9BACT|nr:CehA/McbA family metallohydrolase [Roseiconus lacunae]MDM4014114.1 CehA/McbA family metallohydrolase [Roseiconus lacunae]